MTLLALVFCLLPGVGAPSPRRRPPPPLPPLPYFPPRYRAMPSFGKDSSIRKGGHILFESCWRPQAVARDAHTSQATAFRWENNLALYGHIRVLRRSYYLGQTRSTSPAALNGLLDHQRQNPPGYIRKSWLIT